jgi:molecular chaperone DnaK
MSKVVGIDLGTTNSVVAILENNRPEVIQNAEGSKTTPSVVLFSDSGEIVVGELAKRQMLPEAGRVVYSVKRFMGARFEEARQRLRGIRYDVSAADDDGMAILKVGEVQYRPEDVSAEILKKMAETAEAYLGEPIINAVITVPAHFNDAQRQATKKAAEIAGLNALRIINEPTAAALAFGLNRDEKQRVAVFDFGGGTFDISILDIDGDIYEVRSTGGDTFLGGDNINEVLTEYLMGKVEAETGIDPSTDTRAVQRIAEAAEKAKCELSTLQKTLISLPFLVSDDEGPRHFSHEIARDEFNQLIGPILEGLRPPCEMALADAGIQTSDLSAVLLVGGSTRIPAVRALVEEMFGMKPNASLNPDEAVACGAAIQSAILSGDLTELLLLDVTPLSLGLELSGDVFSPLIPRNSSIPTTVRKNFTTVRDNQEAVNIHVLQGERRIATQNRTLARLRLNDIPRAPREIPEVEVEFHIDANGILTVSAMDLTSGNRKEILVESYQAAATEVDSEKVVAEAAAHADEDRRHMKLIGARKRLEEMEALVQSMRQRADGGLSEGQERTIKEAFFKMEIALAHRNWELVEEAERNAKSAFIEVSSIQALQTTDDDSMMDFGENAGVSETPEPGGLP